MAKAQITFLISFLCFSPQIFLLFFLFNFVEFIVLLMLFNFQRFLSREKKQKQITPSLDREVRWDEVGAACFFSLSLSLFSHFTFFAFLFLFNFSLSFPVLVSFCFSAFFFSFFFSHISSIFIFSFPTWIYIVTDQSCLTNGWTKYPYTSHNIPHQAS